MTIDANPTLNQDHLAKAVVKAEKLIFDISQNWLNRQSSKRSSDPVLMFPQKALNTRPQNIHAIAMDFITEPMHPVAESILSSKQALKDLRNTAIPNIVSSSWYLTLSLADVYDHLNQIIGIEDRLKKLLSRDEWKSTLYELLVAISFASNDYVEILPDSSAGPDIKVGEQNPFYIECKTKLEVGEDIQEFTSKWRRLSVREIFQITNKFRQSFLIKVILKSAPNEYLLSKKIPNTINEMIEKGKYKVSLNNRGKIFIEPWDSKPLKLSSFMTWADPKLLKMCFDFDGEENWHYIFPYYQGKPFQEDERFIDVLSKRLLVCVRADHLKKRTLSLENEIKYAARKQLKGYPGIIFIHLDTKLFGLGINRSSDHIKPKIQNDIERILEGYSRIFAVIIDLSETGTVSNASLKTTRLIVLNRNTSLPKTFKQPKSIIF